MMAAVLFGWIVAGPLPYWHRAAAAAGCEAPAPPVLAFDQARGVRTKWLTLSRGERNTIQPDLQGLPLKQWVGDLEAIDVNLAEVNLEPRRLLASRPVMPDAEINAAASAFYTPERERSDNERARIAAVESNIARLGEYTPDQRNAVQLDFLRHIDALRRQGDIKGSVRFLLHQRLWFPPGGGQAGAEERERRARQFIDDMVSFIQLARRNCLDHWIAGVRLGEHSNPDMSNLLPLIVELAHGINLGTDGWLKTHMFLANGGGWGAVYKGIDRTVGSDGAPYPFFPRLVGETGSFAFGYKWMMFHDEIAKGMRGHMAAAECRPQRSCDPDSVADWLSYLGDTLGFNDLIASIKADHGRYPAVANVVFVGDASDAVTQMVQVNPDGSLAPKPALTAVRQLFALGGGAGFSGKVFMNAFDTVKVATRLQARERGVVDIGKQLYFVDAAGRSHLLPQSYRIWRDWPRP